MSYEMWYFRQCVKRLLKHSKTIRGDDRCTFIIFGLSRLFENPMFGGEDSSAKFFLRISLEPNEYQKLLDKMKLDSVNNTLEILENEFDKIMYDPDDTQKN